MPVLTLIPYFGWLFFLWNLKPYPKYLIVTSATQAEVMIFIYIDKQFYLLLNRKVTFQVLLCLPAIS